MNAQRQDTPPQLPARPFPRQPARIATTRPPGAGGNNEWILIVGICALVGAAGLAFLVKDLTSNPSRPAPELAKPHLEMVESFLTEENRVRYIVGQVRNVSGKPYRSVSVEFELLDSARRKIGTASDHVSGLAAGQTWRFRAWVRDDEMATYRLQGLSGW